MSAIKKTANTAKITWLGRVEMGDEGIRSAALERIEATYAGFDGEKHSGLTRPSCVRVKDMHPEGTDIRNARQFSILSEEELALIAADMGLESVDPCWLGATMIVSGIPDFTHIPPSTRLQTPAGTALVIDMHNQPCQYPAMEIEADRPGHGKGFMAAARGRRGVTAWVEREGPLSVGDTLDVYVPDQRPWAELDAALSPKARAMR